MKQLNKTSLTIRFSRLTMKTIVGCVTGQCHATHKSRPKVLMGTINTQVTIPLGIRTLRVQIPKITIHKVYQA
jgi:hypothetical protein